MSNFYSAKERIIDAINFELLRLNNAENAIELLEQIKIEINRRLKNLEG